MEAFASVGELSEEIAAGLRIERDEALQTIVRSRQELRGRFGETKQELAERYETILQKWTVIYEKKTSENSLVFSF